MSPSVAFGCMELLSVAERNALQPGNVHTLSLGAVPSHEILEVAEDIRWLSVSDDGLLKPTAKGIKALSATTSRARLRLLLLDHLDAQNPPWLQLASSGRREVLFHAPKELQQIFVEAGLAYDGDPETVAFWDALASRARGTRDGALTEIGRLGERLTIEYEEHRTGRIPKWIAIDSNSDGYDVLSLLGPGDSRRLTIEVKTSTMPGLTGHFYISRYEWEVAQDSRFHAFHLWDASGNQPLLAVISLATMQLHVPSDAGHGTWESVRIPFATFKDVFEPYATD